MATRVSPVSLNQESLKHFPLTNQNTGQKKLCHKTALNCPQNADSVEILTGREEIGVELEVCFKGRVTFRLLSSAETDGWMICLQTQVQNVAWLCSHSFFRFAPLPLSILHSVVFLATPESLISCQGLHLAYYWGRCLSNSSNNLYSVVI